MEVDAMSVKKVIINVLMTGITKLSSFALLNIHKLYIINNFLKGGIYILMCVLPILDLGDPHNRVKV